MPGPVSESAEGRSEDSPYVPSWCYPSNAPKMCPCGHHEGYHAGPGKPCVHSAACGCSGLPADKFSSDEEFYASPVAIRDIKGAGSGAGVKL